LYPAWLPGCKAELHPSQIRVNPIFIGSPELHAYALQIRVEVRGLDSAKSTPGRTIVRKGDGAGTGFPVLDCDSPWQQHSARLRGNRMASDVRATLQL
jgi:hypothetical protein